MRQWPEKIEKEKNRTWILVVLLMSMSVLTVTIFFLIYNPNMKNSILFLLFSFIGYVINFVLSTIFPLVLERADMKALQSKIVRWYNIPKRREFAKKVVKVTKIILVLIFVLLLGYMFPRSFPPKMYKIYYELHEATVTDTTDIKVIVETNLTVDKILLDDNEVNEYEVTVCEEKGLKRIYSKVLDFNTEDVVHTITAKIVSNNVNVELQRLSISYILNAEDSEKGAESEKNWGISESATTLYEPEKTIGELTIVCIPADKMKTAEGMREFQSYIGMTNVEKMIEIYSKMALPNLDAFIVVISNKKLVEVTLCAVSETTSYTPFYMNKIDENTWYFDADFTENSNFEITATAYAEDGEIFYDKIEFEFPFE